MTAIEISASKNYKVLISEGLLGSSGELISELVKGKTAVIVSDDNVFPLYGERVKKSLEESGFAVMSFVFPHGERSKSMAVYTELLEFLLSNRLTRSDFLVALGGE